ncbi:MAG: phosphopentomutase [Peptococcia bacterium]
MMKKVILLILDSLGVGAMPDAHLFGEKDSNTLGNINKAVGGLKIPNLAKLGLGRIEVSLGYSEVPVLGAYGKMAEMSQGMDTTTGHWEIAGILTKDPLPTFPEGFPEEIIEAFQQEIGRPVLGNKVASGTVIIEELGPEHLKTGYPIVYTSADSVFQIAAHEEVIPLEQLYEYCRIARRLLTGKWAVGRVIARPFVGQPGSFQRTANRHDYSLEPPQTTVLDAMKEKGLEVIGIGKIHDIFAGRGLTSSQSTVDNLDGVNKTIEAWSRLKAGLIFTNLVEFDSHYGHRNNPQGYAQKIEEFDEVLPRLMELVDQDGLLIISADHGNDPTTPGTDHNREYVPLLVYGKDVKAAVDLGTRKTFADVAATLSEIFNLGYVSPGTSFWAEATGTKEGGWQ